MLSPYKLTPFKISFSVVRILKLKRQEINVSGQEWVVQNKNCPHWFKSVCSDGKVGGWEAHYSNSIRLLQKFAAFPFTAVKSSPYWWRVHGLDKLD